MTEYILLIKAPRPYFAEIPFYLWGMINYGSKGDCKHPTYTNWTWIDLTNRDTGENVVISSDRSVWTVRGDDPSAARVALFLSERCDAPRPTVWTVDCVGDWDHSAGIARATRLAEEFAMPKLAIFDSHLFWGSWKWIGWFATEFTWLGRWIMVSFLKGDGRGVPLCIDWLKQGTFCHEQSAALQEVLRQLTGESFASDGEWVKWYEGDLLQGGAKARYPIPDFDTWLEELKAEYGSN